MFRTLFACALTATLLIVSACSQDPEVAKAEYVQSGDRYFDEKKFAEAIVEYRNAIQVDPRYGEARLKLANAYNAQRDLQNAYREYIRAADLLPDDVTAQLAAAGYLLLARQFEDAQARADRALAIDPKNVDAMIARANALAGQDKMDDALKNVEQAVSVAPDRASSYGALGALRMRRGEREQAIAAYQKAVEVDPKSVPARIAMATFHLADGNRAQAEAALKSALSLQPNHIGANRALADLYISSGRAPEAETMLKTVAANTTDGTGNIVLGDYYLGTKRADQAKVQYEAVQSSSGDNYALARVRLSVMARGTGDIVNAKKYVDEAIARVPTHAEALVMRSTLLREQGDLDGALTAAETAVNANPDSGGAQFSLARAQQAKGNIDAAIGAYTQAVQLNPGISEADVQLSALHLAAGRIAEAEQFARSAVSKSPQDAEALLASARASLARRDAVNAERVLRPLAARFPTNTVILNEVGRLEMLKGNTAAARATYEKVLATNVADVDALSGVVGLDVAAKRLDQVGTRVEAALAKAPNDGRLLVFAARAYAALNDMTRTEQMLRKAIEVAPDRSESYAMLGGLLLNQGKQDEALKEFEALAARRPDITGPPTMIGIIYELKKDRAKAKESYRKALAIDSETPLASNNLAWMITEDNENLDEALQLAQAARVKLPESPQVADTLGWIYHKKGLTSLGLPFLREAAERQPQNPLFQYHAGLAFAQNGDRALAKRFLDSGLKLAPNSAEAGEARRVLGTLGTI